MNNYPTWTIEATVVHVAAMAIDYRLWAKSFLMKLACNKKL
jgi:hypothetical protein